MTILSTSPARRLARSTLLAGIALLSACAGTPAPDWQVNAFGALNNATNAYLSGNTRLADLEFARARSEMARTGRPDLMARVALVRCAAQVASLVLDPCLAYQALAADATPPEQNYAAFIAGRWTGVDPAQLPLPYRDLVAQTMAQARNAASAPATAPTAPPLGQIQDPLSRLIAAGALLQHQPLAADAVALAVDAASSQGWRRPLLAWLSLQRRRAQEAGDAATAATTQRRIDLVLQTPP